MLTRPGDDICGVSREAMPPLTSCLAGAGAPDTGGIHPDEVRRHPLDPRLEPGVDERRTLGLGVQMVRRPPDQYEPPLARFRIDLVSFHRDLVLGLCDSSPQ